MQFWNPRESPWPGDLELGVFSEEAVIAVIGKDEFDLWE